MIQTVEIDGHTSLINVLPGTPGFELAWERALDR